MPADTIFALSSGRPPAAISVIRISGPGRTTRGRTIAGRCPSRGPPRCASCAIRVSGELLDEALVLRFDCAGKLDGENIVEFQCHGGRAVVDAVLAALTSVDGPAGCGARRVHPPRIRERPDRPDRGRRTGGPDRGGDRISAQGGAGAGGGRSQEADRRVAGAACSAFPPRPSARSIMTRRTRKSIRRLLRDCGRWPAELQSWLDRPRGGTAEGRSEGRRRRPPERWKVKPYQCD